MRKPLQETANDLAKIMEGLHCVYPAWPFRDEIPDSLRAEEGLRATQCYFCHKKLPAQWRRHVHEVKEHPEKMIATLILLAEDVVDRLDERDSEIHVLYYYRDPAMPKAVKDALEWVLQMKQSWAEWQTVDIAKERLERLRAVLVMEGVGIG